SRIMDERDNVDLVLVGHVPDDDLLARHTSRIIRYPFISDISEYWSVLSACDINIAPLVLNAAADCKSEIKWLEAAVLSIPTIASGTATYRGIIRDEVDGFIADTCDDWYYYISSLCRDNGKRLRAGRAARERALVEYNLSVGASRLTAVISSSNYPLRD